MLDKLKRLILQLSVFERVTIAVSCLYVLGVILRMQYESLWLLPGFTWNTPLLPFAVAIQYIIYLTIPVATFVLPILCIYHIRNRWNRSTRILCFFCIIIVLHFVFATLFHYFIPYTYMHVPIPGTEMSINFWIVVNFWRMYYSNSLHYIGFAILIAGSLLLYFRKHFRINAKVSLSILLLLHLGVVFNMYSFNQFFYRNISQAAYGGSGVVGILTMENPPDTIRLEYADMPSTTIGETSIPCAILDNAGDWLIILELKRFHDSFGETPLFGRKPFSGIPYSPVTVRKSDVKSFMPLTGCMYFGPDKRFVFMQPFDDSVHRLDAEFRVASIITNGVSAIQRLGGIQGWRDVRFVLDVDDRFSGCADKAYFMSMTANGTNLVSRIYIPQISLSGNLSVDRVQQMMTNSVQMVGMYLNGLSVAMEDMCVTDVAGRLLLNYFNAVNLGEYYLAHILDDEVILSKKRIDTPAQHKKQ